MSTVFRAAAVYLFLLIIFRIAGKRTLNQITTFDAVLLLIISEAIQQAMIDNDNSVTNAFLLVLTLVGMNIFFSVIKQRFSTVERVIDGLPVLVVRDGEVQHKTMDKERVDEVDVLASARSHHGLERMDQVKYAVLEPSGQITVVPTEDAKG